MKTANTFLQSEAIYFSGLPTKIYPEDTALKKKKDWAKKKAALLSLLLEAPPLSDAQVTEIRRILEKR